VAEAAVVLVLVEQVVTALVS